MRNFSQTLMKIYIGGNLKYKMKVFGENLNEESKPVVMEK